ncbi:MAG: hypothetical protein HC767_06235 [Akkermansiaceae bacterium]|nr:hypothetical protein [Akkermansiaceae bacterium]
MPYGRFCWPHLWFDWIGAERLNHPMIWQGAGLLMGLLGIGLIFSARNPVGNWVVILIAFLKFIASTTLFSVALFNRDIPFHSVWMLVINDLIWLAPFAMMLWASLQAHAGVPPTRSLPLSISEASDSYYLSNGKSLKEAAESKLLTLVFLRHFGCTFTRQILRGLEDIQKEVNRHGSELIIIHMLQGGKETQYLGENSGVARIADPRCELYRAFGLGKGGFIELFGPHVWWRGAIAIFKGCGVGHLAGDGLQMPGVFLFRDGEIISSQRAHSAADLPDLPRLFEGLPSQIRHDTVSV